MHSIDMGHSNQEDTNYACAIWIVCMLLSQQGALIVDVSHYVLNVVDNVL